MNVRYHHRECFASLAITIIAMFVTIPANARTNSQALVGTPINDFSLPIFNQSGQLSFRTIGTSATMNEDSQFFVKDAEIFLPNTTSTGHIISAKSEHAIVEPSNQYAHSDSPIQIFGNNFVGNATQWEFFGDSRKLIAHHNVHVKINNDKEILP